MDRFTSMAVFVKSVETGSLSAAARHFGLSQAMVSKHIRGLEQSLGVRLLNLTTRRLSLTEVGTTYYQRCMQILSEVEDANLEAMQLQSVPKGILRLAAPSNFGELHLAPAIADFLLQYPEIVIDVEFSDRFSNLIDEGFDVAVRIGRLPDSSLIVRRLGQSQMLTCASAAYLDQYGEPMHPFDLAKHRCLYLSSATSPGVWWYQDNGKQITVEVTGPLRANSMAMACQAAQQGLGIVFGPAFVLSPLIKARKLEPVLTAFESQSLDINAVYLSNRQLSKKVRLLVDFLVDRFSGEFGWDRASGYDNR